MMIPDDDPANLLKFLDERQAGSPLAAAAFRSLWEQYPVYVSVVLAGAHQGDEFWSGAEDRCREILHLCGGDEEKFRAGVAQWVEFSQEFLAKQPKFLKRGHYASKSFEEVKAALYADEEKMKSFYLIALMFSYLFSSNYIGFFAFFRRAFLPALGEASAVGDIGCGHGVYLSQMLLAAPGARGVGADVSSASLETARRMLAFRGIPEDRFELIEADIQVRLGVPDASLDAMTCFEVIEHLEHPKAALAELRRALRPGGRLCLSTAIRMESIDHIHVFWNPEEVRSMLRDAGFEIVEDEVIPLSSENLSDPATRRRLIDDPRVPLGYVAMLR